MNLKNRIFKESEGRRRRKEKRKARMKEREVQNWHHLAHRVCLYCTEFIFRISYKLYTVRV